MNTINPPVPEIDAEDNASVPDSLNRKVKYAPTRSGVYLMKDIKGRILYVGKARNLRKRLQSYFQKQRPHDPKTTVMLTKVTDFDTLQTGNEKEAFILESSLIKQHRPRYNVNLKDDKRYPSLKLDLREPFPNLTIVRKVQNDGALYFGPYSSAAAVRQTLKFIHKTFKLRKCKPVTVKDRTRPCLNFQMGLCLSPCSTDVDPRLYREIVKEVVAFLRGRTPALIRRVQRQMQAAAQNQEFEKAAQLRDKMFALQNTLEKQVTVTNDFKDRDVVGFESENGSAVITLLNVRSGFLQAVRHFFLENTIGDPGEQIASFLHQYYSKAGHLPAEIVVPRLPAGKESLEEIFSEKKGRKVVLMSGQRGDRAKLIDMAVQNASNELKARQRIMDSRLDLLTRLQQCLGLSTIPRRIECFDNSTWSGSEPVAAMVVFVDGLPQPESYRRYKLAAQGKPDDYAYMAEVIRRRYDPKDPNRVWPDLMLVDGGRGQLNVALSVLKELGQEQHLAIAGIAKKDPARGEQQDKIYLARRANAVPFGRDMDLLLFLQQIRDEAHRWAVRYQRIRRRINTQQSALDAVAGIGPRRKAMLLSHYGSLERLGHAPMEELTALPGISPQLAEAIKLAILSK